MLLLFTRHAVTDKNEKGGVDGPTTPILPKGEEQARALGASLHAYLKAHDVRWVHVITSGYERTNATALHTIKELNRRARRDVVASFDQDPRLAEIKFRSKEFPATAEHPGFFGRQLDGTTKETVLRNLQAFKAEHLDTSFQPGHAQIVFSHRGTLQVLAEQVMGIQIPLWKMNNAECYEVVGNKPGLRIVHDGEKADRDPHDPRRLAFIEKYPHLTQAGFMHPMIGSRKPSGTLRM